MFGDPVVGWGLLAGGTRDNRRTYTCTTYNLLESRFELSLVHSRFLSLHIAHWACRLFRVGSTVGLHMPYTHHIVKGSSKRCLLADAFIGLC